MTTTDVDVRAQALARRAPATALNVPDGEYLGIAEVAERLGLSPHTVRYYERAGLVSVPRDAAGYRQFDAHAVRRLEFLRRMRMSGMGMTQVTHYIELVEAGKHTEPERLDVMLAHRADVRAQLHELQLALAAIEYKINTYGGSLDGECGTDRPQHEGERS